MCASDPSDEIRYHATIALGYLGDSSALDTLLGALEKSPSQAIQAVLAQAIGEIGDKRAVPALERIARDTKRDDLSRSRAVFALGMIGQVADHAWNADLKRAYNFTVATPAMTEILRMF
jgi:HEAT repeat protein